MNTRTRPKMFPRWMVTLTAHLAIIAAILLSGVAVAQVPQEIQINASSETPGRPFFWSTAVGDSSPGSPLSLTVNVQDVLVFNQTATLIPHGITFNFMANNTDMELHVRRCDETGQKPNALLVEIPTGAADDACLTGGSNIEVPQPGGLKPMFAKLRVERPFSDVLPANPEVHLRCIIHANVGQMEIHLKTALPPQPPNGVMDSPIGDQTISVGDSVDFAATVTDPDSAPPFTHNWNFGGAGIPDAAVEDPGSRTFNTVGTFTVTYTVTDAEGNVDPSPASVQITVEPPQAPNGVIDTPVGNQTISVGDSVDFAATVTDPDSAPPFTHNWNFGGAGIPDAAVEDPGSRTFNTVGTFTVTYTVTDPEGNVDPTPATVQITVGDIPPPTSPDGVIDTPVGNQTISVGDSVDFAATVTDPDSAPPFTHNWNFGGAGIPDAAVEDPGSRTFNTVGTFTVTYTVTDPEGNVDPTPATVQITVGDIPPPTSPDGVIDTPVGNQTISVGDSVDFAATVTDPDSAPPFTHNWNFGGAGIPDAAVEDPGSRTFNTVGTFTVTYTVTDPEGNVDPTPATVQITVGDIPPPTSPDGVIDTPVGNLTIPGGGSVNFTGTGSDPDNNLPLTHLWNFGAGSGIPDATVEDPGEVTFNNFGVFTVTYTVTDAEGLADPTPATVEISVEQDDGTGGNMAPNVDAGDDQIITLPNDEASLGGTVMDDGLPDPPGEVTTEWSQVSGLGTATFADKRALVTTVSFSTAGTYPLRLTANDSALKGSDVIIITVKEEDAPPELPPWKNIGDMTPEERQAWGFSP